MEDNKIIELNEKIDILNEKIDKLNKINSKE